MILKTWTAMSVRPFRARGVFGLDGYQGACGTLRYHRMPRWGQDADSPRAKCVNGDSEG
jgi:hypothetical protein